jgi:hypothetical protein
MSYSDETQQYLLVRPPQSIKPGKHTSHNLQVQRLLKPHSADSTEEESIHLPHGRIIPILNLETHAIRATRIVETDTAETLCKFSHEPKGVLGKWQVDVRRGDGGGWIFVGKYERYEWAKSRGNKGEEMWSLVRATYSQTKAAGSVRRRRKSTLSESRTIRASMDDVSPTERKLLAKIVMMSPSPPSITISPRNPRNSRVGSLPGGFPDVQEAEENVEEIELVNKEEVLDALIQGLWIVWREGVVEDNAGQTKRNSWTTAPTVSRKKSVWDKLLCRD